MPGRGGPVGHASCTFRPDTHADGRPHVPEMSPTSSIPDPDPPAVAGPTRSTVERIVSVHRWTPRLVSFRTTRPPVFGYVPGLYARLGLDIADTDAAGPDGPTVWRAFSMVSAPAEAALEFVATLVEGGAFSALLARCVAGREIRVASAAYGFLTLSQLAPGPELWLMASGTGVGPFVSMLRDDRAWQTFERIVLVHSVRHAADLAYRDELIALQHASARGAGASTRAALRYLPAVTREAVPGALAGRIPALLEDGRLEAAAGLTLDAQRSRAMVCGNPDLTAAMRAALSARGLRSSRRGVPGQVAFEKYW